MAFVVNAAMLRVAGWLADKVDVEFSTGPFFWSTVLAAVVVTIVSVIVNKLLGEDDRRKEKERRRAAREYRD
jgi:putative membrane protein